MNEKNREISGSGRMKSTIGRAALARAVLKHSPHGATLRVSDFRRRNIMQLDDRDGRRIATAAGESGDLAQTCRDLTDEMFDSPRSATDSAGAKMTAAEWRRYTQARIAQAMRD